MKQYSIGRDIKNSLKFSKTIILTIIFCLPVIYYLTIRRSYEFRDSLDVFAFMLEVVTIFFPILATLIYLPSFSEELKNRFLVYTRLRISIKRLFFIKFSTNFLLSFSFFFVFTFLLFILSFYIFPSIGAANLQPEAYSLNEITVREDSYTRYTFSQILKYGSFTYGLVYSFWVGLNAAVYTSIGFLLLFLIPYKFIAMTVPTLIYLIGSYILSVSNLRPFRFIDSIFPYSYIQQPIWTAIIPFIVLSCISLLLYFYIRRNINCMEDMI